jgi:hypothetical protein
LQIRIKPASNNSDTSAPLFYRSYSLPAGANYVAMAAGNIGTGFAANPNNIATGFDLTILTDGRLASTAQGQAQIKVFHGAPDAPTVRVKVSGTTSVLVPQASFRQSSGWLDAGSANINVDVDAFATGGTVATFVAPLAAFKDSALLVAASGYLTPAANNNGPAFGLLVVTAKGSTVLLPTAPTAIGRRVAAAALSLAPNPAQDVVQIALPEGTLASATVLDMAGRQVLTSASAALEVGNLQPGVYYVVAKNASGQVYQARLMKQ